MMSQPQIHSNWLQPAEVPRIWQMAYTFDVSKNKVIINIDPEKFGI